MLTISSHWTMLTTPYACISFWQRNSVSSIKYLGFMLPLQILYWVKWNELWLITVYVIQSLDQVNIL